MSIGKWRVGRKGGAAEAAASPAGTLASAPASAATFMSLADLWKKKQDNSALRLEVNELKRRVDALDEEWSDYYDRFRRMLAKMAKRAEREQANEVREDAPTEGVREVSGNGLTPSQMQHQARILERRQRLTVRGGE